MLTATFGFAIRGIVVTTKYPNIPQNITQKNYQPISIHIAGKYEDENPDDLNSWAHQLIDRLSSTSRYITYGENVAPHLPQIHSRIVGP